MPAAKVMHEWKAGNLHSGSKKGPVVKSRKQAVAIMLSEKEQEDKDADEQPQRMKKPARSKR
jgi:hypothetical protein